MLPALLALLPSLACAAAPPRTAAGLAPSAPDFPVQTRVEADTYRFLLLEVKFPSAERSVFKINDTVWGHLYLPRPQARDAKAPPCILILPVMAAPNDWIELRFVQELLLARYAVMWVEMPYQFHRRPLPDIPSGQVFLARTPGRLSKNFRQSISDARRALDWLNSSGLVDPARIGLFGISLGALVGASAFSVDPRPRAAIFALGGADFPSLVMHGSMTAQFLRRAGLREAELREAWEGIDPEGYREANAGKRVLLINARGDTVIPYANAVKLKESFPGARQAWVPFGHYGALLHLTWMPSYVARAFRGLLD